MKAITSFIAALAVAFTFQAASAQVTMPSASQPDTVTANFLHNATLGGLKEIKTGQLAARKGKSLSVKAYGTKMVVDHTKANSKLQKLADGKGYVIKAPTSAELATPAMLANTTGATFDKNYVSMMLVDHQNTIKIFENAALNSSDASIKAYANQTLPTLRAHLTSLQSIAKTLGVTSMQ
jgi:putative membrane protein